MPPGAPAGASSQKPDCEGAKPQKPDCEGGETQKPDCEGGAGIENSHDAWLPLRNLEEIDVAYGQGDYDRACELIAEIATIGALEFRFVSPTSNIAWTRGLLTRTAAGKLIFPIDNVIPSG
jgi:hypothetical protein